MFSSLANFLFSPVKARRIAERVLPFAAVFCVLALGAGVYQALVASPPDYQQGEAVRMMYVHVPAAWTALGVYVFMGVCSICGIVFSAPAAFMLCRAAAAPGALFCGLCLLTGALWGKPIWGAWWAWDARLTSTLVLFLFYISYLQALSFFREREKAERAASALCIIGLINVPIVKFSVEWWNTLHQPASVMRGDGIAIHGEMLLPLMLMFFAYACFTCVISALRFLTALDERKTERLQQARQRNIL